MLSALRAVGRGIGQFEHYGWLFVLTNILTVGLSLPIITAPAAYAALSHLSHTAQTTQTATVNDYWEGFRASFRRSLIIGGINVAVMLMLIVNFRTYELQSSLWFVVLRLVWLVLFALWLLVQVYLWPLLDEMTTPNLREGLRNAVVMLVLNPVFSLTLFLALALLMVLSTVLAAVWIVITFGLLVNIANAAVLDRLQRARTAGLVRGNQN